MGELIQLPNKDSELLSRLLQAPSIVDSVCNWNAARYPQEPSPALSMSLLFEEFKELETAYSNEDRVAILDGLGDLFFVTVGILWKSGLSASEITSRLDTIEEMMPMLPPISVALHWYQEDSCQEVLFFLVLSITKQLEWLLGSEQLAMDVYRAICISNNSKKVEKTAKTVKANLDKGLHYKSPTEMLKKILTRSEE